MAAAMDPSTYRMRPEEGAAAAAEQRAQLVVLDGPDQGRCLALGAAAGAEVHIGKAKDNALQIDHPTVSRRHCTLVRDGAQWLLRDCGSTNGTYVDGARVKEIYLRHGATIRVGEIGVRYECGLAPLRLSPSPRTSFGQIHGASVTMREVFALLERLARSEATALIAGETGTGKGAVARAIHEQSARACGPFVVVDCGAVAPGLIESELFGHERGAFTGAEQRRIGAFERAQGGTLFLDEVDDLRPELQPKLLRALEERTFQRVGSSQAIRLDLRVVAATKRKLSTLVARGAFREDLYFRLAVFQLELPPLRVRIEDIPGLVDRFARAFGCQNLWSDLPPSVQSRLSAHAWPGNVRELRNVVERALVLADGVPAEESAWQPDGGSSGELDSAGSLFGLPIKEARDRFDREYVSRLLARCDGNVARAAREAQFDRKHFYELIHRHGLLGHPALRGRR